MSDKDSLGDRMKRYETVPRSALTRRLPMIVRVDGPAVLVGTTTGETTCNLYRERKGVYAMTGDRAMNENVVRDLLKHIVYARECKRLVTRLYRREVPELTADVLKALFKEVETSSHHELGGSLPWKIEAVVTPLPVRIGDPEVCLETGYLGDFMEVKWFVCSALSAGEVYVLSTPNEAMALS